MEFLAYVAGARVGTAQVLTFAFPIGMLGVVCFWGFFQRSGRRRFGPPRQRRGTAGSER